MFRLRNEKIIFLVHTLNFKGLLTLKDTCNYFMDKKMLTFLCSKVLLSRLMYTIFNIFTGPTRRWERALVLELHYQKDLTLFNQLERKWQNLYTNILSSFHLESGKLLIDSLSVILYDIFIQTGLTLAQNLL